MDVRCEMFDRIEEMEMIVESPSVKSLFRRHDENALLADALKMKERLGDRSNVLKDVRQYHNVKRLVGKRELLKGPLIRFGEWGSALRSSSVTE